MPSVERIPLGYNNVYVLEGGGETLLIDTGPDFDGAAQAILDHLGTRQPSIVVATHAHHDHAGLGSFWQERGIPVALGERDVHLARAPHFSRPGEFEAFLHYIDHSGAPPSVRAELRAGLKSRREWVQRAASQESYPRARPTDRWPTGLRYPPFEPAIRFGSDASTPEGTRIVSCPGHTPGNLVLTVESEGWLFSGDQLLPDITPTPGVQFLQDEAGEWRRFASLPPFIESLHALRALRLERCFPGHGDTFGDVQAVIDANLAQVEQRTERVFTELGAAGPSCVHGLADRLYPRALRRRWWQIVATVQGHLDLLAVHGRARDDAGVWTPLP